MNKEDFKNLLVSIFIGACVAFIGALCDGVIEVLKGYGNSVAGGLASSVYYAIRHIRIT
jgi:hypothetical protein